MKRRLLMMRAARAGIAKMGRKARVTMARMPQMRVVMMSSAT